MGKKYIDILHKKASRIVFYLSRLGNIHASSRFNEPDSLNLALDWIKKAQDSTSSGGVSRGYSMVWDTKFKKIGWQPPYPETTGYIIPTMIKAGKLLQQEELIRRAKAMADWELGIMFPNGGVPGGHLSSKNNQAAIFDTGQVLRGLNAIYLETKEKKYLEAGKKSADWILGNEEDGTGQWIKSNATCVNPKTTTYNIYAIAPIVELGLICNNEGYINAGRRAAEFVLKKQGKSGWFNGADFEDRPDALLHTIGYTIDGLWDIGSLLHEEKYLKAAKVALDALCQEVNKDGFLPGRLYEDWQGSVKWSCLTGMAQIGVTCLKAYGHFQDEKYLAAADRLKKYLLARQNKFDKKKGGIGAIFGSWPVSGGYQPYQSLNWAVKYYVDLLIDFKTIENKEK